MVGCKFSLTCLILIFCVINAPCETTGHNPCDIEIPCDDSQCIERQEWCDLFEDCTDGSDEKYCKKKTFWSTPDNKCDAERHFTCKNRMCIPKVLRCDGYDDCKDNSDEENCDSSETGGTIGQDSLNNSSAESTHSSSTDVPPYPSTTEFPHSLRPVEPTVDFYDHRWMEGGNTPRHPYNSPTATASAYPPVHPPDPTPDSRISPTSGWNRNERSFGNVDSQAWPFYGWGQATTKPPPPQEPCDKTTSRSDDDSASRYRVPWSHFTFESSHGDTIKSQYYNEARRAQEWLLAQYDNMSIWWGANTPRALVALSLSSDATNNVAADDILHRRLRIDLGASLIKWRQGTQILSASRLALYINALIATCQNPRKMYDMDLVEMLYEVQKDRVTRADASPFPYLTLCLADRQLTEDDRGFLLDIARRHVTDEISKDKFILATSALACLKKRDLPPDRELERSVDDAFRKLQQQQLNNGSFGSVYSTALAAQALIAIDSRSWNPKSTLQYLSSKQHEDGSFGDFLATYYALPVLSGKSLLHLRNVQCTPETCEIWNCHHFCRMTQTGPECYCRPGFELDTKDSKICIEIPPPLPVNKTVTYSLVMATQTPYTTLASLDLVVPEEYSFFDIMKEAQAKDKRFRFLSVEHDNKIDVYQISGIPNDPEFGLFWILYKVKRNDHVVSKQRYTQDIRKLIPENSDKLFFYYVHFKPGSQ